MNTEAKKLYTALLGKGYTVEDIGDEATFENNLQDSTKQKELYDYVTERGDFRLGDYESYEQRLALQSLPNPHPNSTITKVREEVKSEVSQPSTAQVDYFEL